MLSRLRGGTGCRLALPGPLSRRGAGGIRKLVWPAVTAIGDGMSWIEATGTYSATGCL